MRALSAPRIRFAPWALLLGLALILVAACNADASDEQPPATPIPEEDLPRPPDGAILIDGIEYPLGLGSYCWGPVDGTEGPALCADAIGYITATPYARAQPGDAITIAGPLAAFDFDLGSVQLALAPDEPIAEGDEPVAWEAWHPQFEPGNTLPSDGGEMRLPADLEPGRYLIALHITQRDHAGNSATYAAIIEVE